MSSIVTVGWVSCSEWLRPTQRVWDFWRSRNLNNDQSSLQQQATASQRMRKRQENSSSCLSRRIGSDWYGLVLYCTVERGPFFTLEVTTELMKLAKPDAIFMNCRRLRADLEVVSYIILYIWLVNWHKLRTMLSITDTRRTPVIPLVAWYRINAFCTLSHQQKSFSAILKLRTPVVHAENSKHCEW